MGQENKIVKREMNEGHRLFFIKPRKGENSDLFINKLLNIKEVEEVLLTSGDAGFVVKVKSKEDDTHADLLKAIKTTSGRDYLQVQSHYMYKRVVSKARL